MMLNRTELRLRPSGMMRSFQRRPANIVRVCIENGFMRAAENGHGLGQDQARKLRSSGMRCSVHGGNKPLAGPKHPYRGTGLPMSKINDLFRYPWCIGHADRARTDS